MRAANPTPSRLKPLVHALRRRAGRIGAAGLLLPSLAAAGPSGGEVIDGEATIRTPTGTTTTIDQGSHSAVINWDRFSIGGEEYVIFNQPSSSAVALNRVLGGAPSEIFGQLLANGRVFLVNPAGVLFAPGAQLDVGGLVATTLDIADEDFMNGRYVFSEGGDGEIVNQGRIEAGDGGFVVLAADAVTNRGLIQARMGEVVLASGSAMTLDLSGEGLIGFSVDQATLAERAGVGNLGSIVADGGSVLMSAAVARELLGTVVNNEGLVHARSIEQGAGGSIILSAEGGDIRQSGTLDASGGGDGGRIALRAGGDILLADGSRTLAAGGAGRGGELRALAAGELLSAARAEVDVRGGSGGGFVELSGRQGIGIRGSQQIGPGGRLLIDPSEITIGSSNDGCLFDYCYELLESMLSQGSDVQLVAENRITFLDTGDGVLDGRGGGASLLIGTGTIDEFGGFLRGSGGDILFGDDSTNLFLIDGPLRVYAGYETGSILDFASLSAGGHITMEAGADIQAGSLSSGGGGIAVFAESDGYGGNDDGSGISLYAAHGAITVGDITIEAPGAAILDAVAGGGDLVVSGDISLHAGAGPVGPPGQDQLAAAAVSPAETGYGGGAWVSLQAQGDVLIAGGLSLGFEGLLDAYEGETDGYRYLEGSAGALLAGDDVSIAGDTAIRGYGDSGLDILAEGTASTGNVAITALAAIEAYHHESYVYEERYGTAYLGISAGEGSAVALGGVALQGPDAEVGIDGGGIDIGGDFSVQAYEAGSEDGAYRYESANGELLVESSFGGAGTRLTARSGGVAIDGTLSLSGPTAGVTIASAGDVGIGGSVSVHGSGYAVIGDATQLLDSEGLAGSPVPTLLLPPLPDAGQVAWGGAGLLIGGLGLENGEAGTSNYAGAVDIGGDLSASGQGMVTAQLLADAVDIEGAVSTEAALGSIEGSWRERRYIDGSAYELRRTVTGSAGEGPARFAQSGVYIELLGGDASIGDIGAAGGSAYVQLGGGDTWSVGDISVAGGLGAQANDYADITQYSLLDETGPVLADTRTRLVGGLNSFAIGDEGNAPVGFSAGDIGVAGTGLSMLAVEAGGATTGSLGVLAEDGLVDSDDPSVIAAPVEAVIGEAGLRAETEAPMTTGAIRVGAAGGAQLGGSFDAAGDVDVIAGEAIGASLPLSLFAAHPLANGAGVQDSYGGQAPAYEDLPLSPLSVAADGAVSLQFSQDSALDALSLSGASIAADGQGADLSIAGDATLGATGALTLGALNLSAQSIALSGDSLALGDAALATGVLALRQYSGDLAFGDFEGSALSLQADAGSLSAGDISAASLSAQAGADLTLGNLAITESLLLSAGDAAGTQIRIGDIDFDGALAFDYANADLSLGEVTVQTLDVALGGGEVRFGNLDAQRIVVETANIDGMGSSLSADELSLSATQSLALDAITIEAGQAALAGDDGLALSGSSIAATGLALSSANAHVTIAGSELSAGSLAIEAGGDVLAGGDASTITAGGLGVSAAGRIDLAAASLSIGNAAAPFGGDTALIDLLPATLRPTSQTPNASFVAAQGVRLGAIDLSGDHLYLHSDAVQFSGSIAAPLDLFVQFRPFSDGASMGIENSGGTQAINFSVDEHVTVFPGTTLAFGGSGYAGDIVIGDAGALDLSGRDTNFVFLTRGDISGSSTRLPTNGEVVVLGGNIVDPPVEPGLAEAVPPEPEGSLPGEGFVLASEFDEDDDDLIDETSGGSDAECE